MNIAFLIKVESGLGAGEKTNIAYFGKEQLLSRGSDIDIFLAQHGRMNPIDINTISSEPGFKAIKAIRENKFFLFEESLVSRPTKRILDGISQLFELFHDSRLEIEKII